MRKQIEQFIETIFPTQNIKEIAASEEQKKKMRREQGAMDSTETLFLVGTVLFVLFLVGGLMVGPRFSAVAAPWRRFANQEASPDRNGMVAGCEVRQGVRGFQVPLLLPQPGGWWPRTDDGPRRAVTIPGLKLRFSPSRRLAVPIHAKWTSTYFNLTYLDEGCVDAQLF